jgi:ATP diphosphatase
MYTIDDLLTLMRRLREPAYGCPWDQVQTYKTIAPSTLEEAYEVVDAIEQGDKQQLREELGDLLFQVIFYSELGREDAAFDFSSIVSELTAKLIRRHPHVFPEGTLDSRISLDTPQSERDEAEASVKASWEAIKRQEREAKGHTSLLDDVPHAFPAVVRTGKLQKRAAAVGFDWPDSCGAYDALAEEITELKAAQASQDTCAMEDELGDVLFSVINVSRHLKIDPETALRRANSKFEQRFRRMEQQALIEGLDFSTLNEQQLDVLWRQAKECNKLES